VVVVIILISSSLGQADAGARPSFPTEAFAVGSDEHKPVLEKRALR